MRTVPVQCRCGQVVQISRDPGGSGVRCPSCGALVRGPSPRRSPAGQSEDSHPADHGSSAERDLDIDTDDAGYPLAPDLKGGFAAPAEPAQGTWVPLRGRAAVPGGRDVSRHRAAGPTESSNLLSRIQRQTVDLPGPFLTGSALIYPFLYPTWVRWLGLSFVSILAAGVLSITLFVSWIIIQFQLFLAVFAIASMAMVNLALISYVIACFVEAIEETASGEDRLNHLVDMNWWEILPRFFRVTGAAGAGVLLTFLSTQPLRLWFPADEPVVRLVQGVILFQILPILLLTNLVDGTVIPLWSLPGTLRRLAACVPQFAAFLAITGLVTIAVALALNAMRGWHILTALAGAGPIIAVWLLYYGHWLGRLTRQLSDIE